MEVIRFDRVCRSFMPQKPRFFKDALLHSRQVRLKAHAKPAVVDLTFQVKSGEAVALLGHNGSGKSTTLKLLARVLRPSSGRVLSRGRIAPLLQLGAGFHPELTGRENVFLNAAILGVRRRRIAAAFDEIVAFAGLEESIDQPVRSYSTGMYARLGFAIAVNVDPDILLVDEVLSVGDREFQGRSLERMRQLVGDGRTLILVTHSFSEAVSFCDRAIVLKRGHCVFDGPIQDARDVYFRDGVC